MMVFCDCGLETTVADAEEFLIIMIQHDHICELLKFVCVCGAELSSSSRENITPGLRAFRDGQWLDDHANCTARVQ